MAMFEQLNESIDELNKALDVYKRQGDGIGQLCAFGARGILRNNARSIRSGIL